MIQNERQYKITQTKLREFEDAIAELKTLPAPTTRNEQLDYQLYFNAFTSQIEEFKEEIAEYEQLKQGKTEHLDLDFLEKLPEALIKARIARGLTQEQLADRLNVKP
jgi:ribosome-binding protein aMBF1 (putative translation factor)